LTQFSGSHVAVAVYGRLQACQFEGRQLIARLVEHGIAVFGQILQVIEQVPEQELET